MPFDVKKKLIRHAREPTMFETAPFIPSSPKHKKLRAIEKLHKNIKMRILTMFLLPFVMETKKEMHSEAMLKTRESVCISSFLSDFFITESIIRLLL